MLQRTTKPNPEHERLFGYARVSKARGHVIKSISAKHETMEAPGEISIQRQLADFEVWAAKRDKPITIDFDEGVSGFEVSWKKRPGFQRIVNQMRPGDRLVLWRLDRLDRGMGEILACARWLVEDKKLKVHTLYEQSGDALDLDTMQGAVLLHCYSMVATIEHHKLRAATKAALDFRRRVGMRYCAWPGYGRRFEKRKMGGKIVTFVVWDQHECDLIREIKRRRESGETWYEIALDLHLRQKCKPSPHGGYWLTFDHSRLINNQKANPVRVRRVYAWYEILLRYGLQLGDDGVPAGIDTMAREFGVDEETVREILGKTDPARLRHNAKHPRPGFKGMEGAKTLGLLPEQMERNKKEQDNLIEDWDPILKPPKNDEF